MCFVLFGVFFFPCRDFHTSGHLIRSIQMNKGKERMMYEEDEEEPFQKEENLNHTDETVALCLLGKLWTDRPYNKYGLIETMKKV